MLIVVPYELRNIAPPTALLPARLAPSADVEYLCADAVEQRDGGFPNRRHDVFRCNGSNNRCSPKDHGSPLLKAEEPHRFATRPNGRLASFVKVKRCSNDRSL